MYAVRFMSKLVVTILEQNVRVRRREQLTCRANGLKKTLQQIIEHTEKRKATVSISFLLQLWEMTRMSGTIFFTSEMPWSYRRTN